VTVTQVLTVAITTVLIAGLLIAGASVLDQQSASSGRNQLQVVGERIANDVQQANSLGETGENATVTIRTDRPERVSGLSYEVTLTDDGAYGEDCSRAACLVLTIGDSDVTVVTELPIEGSVVTTDSTVSGGAIVVSYDDTITLEEGR